MEQNKTLTKIEQLMDERQWTMYKLAKESDIPYSSLNALFHKNNQPTLSTLEKICAGFNISMYEFFLDYPPYREEGPKLTESEANFLEIYRNLSSRDKRLLYHFAQIMQMNHSSAEPNPEDTEH